MFTSKPNMTAREVRSAHAQLDKLLAARESWYDGTLESVDRRLSHVSQAIPVVARAAQHNEDMLIECERLREERRALHEFRAERMQGTAERRAIPRKSHVGPMSYEAREFIATELRHFLADNQDAIDDPDELDERAQNHAELATIQMPLTTARNVVDHFRLAANWASKPKQAPAPVRQASVAHLPDEMLFD